MTRPILDVKRAVTALRERHSLDWDMVVAMAFELSRQRNISLTQALNDLLVELDQAAGAGARIGGEAR
jgi:hypothetical protein